MKTSIFDLYRFGCKVLFAFYAIAVSLSLCGAALAQQQQPTRETNSNTAAVASTVKPDGATRVNEPYRIGTGDVLDIRIFPRTQLSIVTRVNDRGMISMPLLESEIMAACKTETELAGEIAALYKKYQRNPSVTIFISEYNAMPIAVIGAVEKPGQFLLKRRMRLLDMISAAGGPKKEAGSRVVVAHTGNFSICQQQTPEQTLNVESASEDLSFTTYAWRSIMQGDPSANPWMKPGDIITIPEADQAFVVGNVFKPQSVTLKEPTTLTQAIAMAGGWLKNSKTSKVKIIRQPPGSKERVEMVYDLVAIEKRKIEDPFLQANDVVTVPEDTWKSVRSKIVNALTGGLQGFPYIIR